MRGELTLLYLEGCRLGDAGAETVAAFLRKDETVKKVWLKSCKIGLRGLEAIAEAVKHNKTVEIINLCHNHFGSKGALLIIDALSTNACIQRLPVFGCSFTPESVATIEFLTESRNKVIIPAAVRRTSLLLIAARRTLAGAGILAIFPKEIVKMIAMEVWATRKDPKWTWVLSEFERTGVKRY